jgi:hypothetical protein
MIDGVASLRGGAERAARQRLKKNSSSVREIVI